MTSNRTDSLPEYATRLSICIPTYNQGQYIQQCLDSIYAQTLAPREVIISDNHCTDETADILQRSAQGFTVVRPPEHIPSVNNFQFCVEHATGEWVAMVASDDFLQPTFVEAFARAIMTAPDDAAMLCGGHYYVDHLGQRIAKRSVLRLRHYLPAPASFVAQFGGPLGCLDATAFRRSIWEKVGGFDRSILHSFDWKLWIDLTWAGGGIKGVPEIVNNYRFWMGEGRTITARQRFCMENHITMFRDCLFPRAQQLGDKAVRVARMAAARHGRSALELIGTNQEGLPILHDDQFMREYATVMGCMREYQKMLAGSYRTPPSTRLLRRLRATTRLIAERTHGWN